MHTLYVQVLEFIAPNHKVAQDIASYFRPPDPQEHTEDDVFPEVPMSGRHKKRRKKNIYSKRTKQKSRTLNKKIPSNPPLIINIALHNTTAAAAALPSTTDDRHADQLFDSQPTDNILPPVAKDRPPNELLPPPFSEQVISDPSKDTNQCTLLPTKPREGFSVNEVIKSAGKHHSNSPESLSSCELEYIPTDETCLLATPSIPVPMTISFHDSNKPEFAVLSEATNQMSRSPSVSGGECLSAADLESVFVSVTNICIIYLRSVDLSFN